MWIYNIQSVDIFVAPSRYLQRKFISQFSLPQTKVHFMPYGFDLTRLVERRRVQHSSGQERSHPYVFAYIGRHQPAKGLHLLVSAALKLIADNPLLSDKFLVRIYGRADINIKNSLDRVIHAALPQGEVFEWHNEYNNFKIVSEVFNHVDCIIVPSIWEENSPLVIHEAQQCGVPVITSDFGGMRELVQDGINGLTFEHRSFESLSTAMLPTRESEEIGRAGLFIHHKWENSLHIGSWTRYHELVQEAAPWSIETRRHHQN